MQILFPLLWAFAILLAMTGLGQLLAALLKKSRPPLGIAAAYGFALTATLFGIFNLAAIISRQLILLYIVAGLAIFLFNGYKNLKSPSLLNKPKFSLPIKIIFTLLIALALLRTTATIQLNSFGLSSEARGVPFNLHDDFQAYLVFPEKMLQAGSLGRDPFSERRLATSLGPAYGWDTLLLAELPEDNLHLLDPGLGLLMGLLITCHLATLLKTPPHRTALLLAILLMVLHINMNITSHMIPAALLLAALYTFLSDDTNQFPFANTITLALLTAAIAGAKSTLIIPDAILIAAYHLYPRPRQEFCRALRSLFLITAMTILFLLPWIIALYQAFDTAPLQLLTNHLALPLPTPLTLYAEYVLPPIIFLILFFLLARRSNSKILPVLTALTLSLLIALPLIALSAGPDAMLRHGFPLLFAALAFFPLAFCTLPQTKLIFHLTTAGFIGLALLHIPQAITLYTTLLPRDLAATFRNDPFFDQQSYAAATALQNAVPPNAPLLARLSYPSLLDFQRNPIYLIDLPGGYFFNPTPDLPFFQGPEPLAHYLLQKNLRYIAYSYRTEANFPHGPLAYRLTDPDPQFRLNAQKTFDFQSNLLALAQTHLILYQDDQNFLLDLATPPPHILKKNRKSKIENKIPARPLRHPPSIILMTASTAPFTGASMSVPSSLAKYLADKSPGAFAQLVRENINLVHAAACRQLADPHLADDVTQAVFILLTRKAPTIRGPLAGWLITTTHYACRDARKLKARREHHERQVMNRRPEISPPDHEPDWQHYAPFIDAALVHLSASDRDALTLRYLQNLPLREVGRAQNISEEAARKRVDRALSKLRAHLSRRTAIPAIALLATALAAESAHAAPAALTLAITSTAATSAASALIAKATAKSLFLLKAKLLATLAATTLAILTATASITYIATKSPATNALPPTTPITAPLAAAPIPDPDEPESKIPGDTQLVRYDALLTADALPDFLKIATPLNNSQSKLYQPYTANGADLRRLIRDAIANNTFARTSTTLNFAQGWNEGSLKYTLILQSFLSFNNWKTADNPPVAINGVSNHTNDIVTRLATGGLHLHIEHPDLNLTIADTTPSLRWAAAPPAAILYDGDLPSGDALIFLAKLTSPSNTPYYHLVIWESFHALPQQMLVFHAITDPLWWCIHGPALPRQLADIARLWSAQAALPLNHVAPPFEQKLSDGKTVRLLALGRPSLYPGCWWDAQGNPIQTPTGSPSITENPPGKLYALIEVTGDPEEYNLAYPQNPLPPTPQVTKFNTQQYFPINENIPGLPLGILVGPWKDLAHLTPNNPVTVGDTTYLVDHLHTWDPNAFLVHFHGTTSENADDYLSAVTADTTQASSDTPSLLITYKNTHRAGEDFQPNFYDITLDKIKYFRVQERKREWITLAGFAKNSNIAPPTIATPEMVLAAEKAQADRKAQVAINELKIKRQVWKAIPPDPATPRGFMRALITAAQNKDKAAFQKLLFTATPAGKPLLDSLPDALIANASLWHAAALRFGEQPLRAAVDSADGRMFLTDMEAEWIDQTWAAQPDGSQISEDFTLRKSRANTYLLDLDALAKDPGVLEAVPLMKTASTSLEKLLHDKPALTLPQFTKAITEIKSPFSPATSPATEK